MILLDQPAEGLARIAKAIEIDSRAALDVLGLPPDESIGTLADPESAIVSRCRQVAALLETNQNDNPAGLAALAALYALSGDRDRAMRSYLLLAAGSHTATGPETLYTQALGAMHARHYDSAEDKFVRWLAAHPDDSVARFDLLRVRRRLAIKQIDQLFLRRCNHRLLAISDLNLLKAGEHAGLAARRVRFERLRANVAGRSAGQTRYCRVARPARPGEIRE